MKNKPAKKQIVKCVVACFNSNGEPDFYFVKIKLTPEQFESGDHHKKADEYTLSEGYETCGLVYDQEDFAFTAFSRRAFDWKNATIVEI